MKKKILSLLLALVLCFFAYALAKPMRALAEDEIGYYLFISDENGEPLNGVVFGQDVYTISFDSFYSVLRFSYSSSPYNADGTSDEEAFIVDVEAISLITDAGEEALNKNPDTDEFYAYFSEDDDTFIYQFHVAYEKVFRSTDDDGNFNTEHIADKYLLIQFPNDDYPGYDGHQYSEIKLYRDDINFGGGDFDINYSETVTFDVYVVQDGKERPLGDDLYIEITNYYQDLVDYYIDFENSQLSISNCGNNNIDIYAYFIMEIKDDYGQTGFYNYLYFTLKAQPYFYFYENGVILENCIDVNTNQNVILTVYEEDIVFNTDLYGVEFSCPGIKQDVEQSENTLSLSINEEGIYTIYAYVYPLYESNVGVFNPISVSLVVRNQEQDYPNYPTYKEYDGEFYFERYEYTTDARIEIPFNCSNPHLMEESLRVIVISNDEVGEAYFNENTKQIVFEPFKNGVTKLTVIFIVNGQFVNLETINVRVVSQRLNIEEYFVEGRSVQVLLGNGTYHLSIPDKYEDMRFNSEIIAISTNRSVADFNSREHDYYYSSGLDLSLFSVGKTDIYLVYRNDYQQVVFKTTLSIIDEETNIQIEVHRDGDSTSAISKFDELHFAINATSTALSSNLKYEWLDGNSVVSTDPKFIAKLTEGSHLITVRVHDVEFDKHYEATKSIIISPYQYQLRKLSFVEQEVHLVMLKNSYDLQVLLDGMISDEYKYTFSADNDAVLIYDNGTSKLTILPNHTGVTTIYAYTNIGIDEEKIISGQITVYVDKIESVGYQLSQEFPKPNKPFDIILTVNDRTDYKNTDFQFAATANLEPVNGEQKGNVIHFENPIQAIYDFSFAIGSLNGTGSIKVSNFNFKEFLRKLLPIVLALMVIIVIIYAIITRGLSPYRSITKALNALDCAYQAELKRTEHNQSAQSLKKAYSNLHNKTKHLMNRIMYFADEGFDGIESAMKSVINLDVALIALIHSVDSLSGSRGYQALKKTYDNIFTEIKNVVNQTIESQLHYQQQLIENNKEDLPEKAKNTKKSKVDYKKELYKNGVLDQVETDDQE